MQHTKMPVAFPYVPPQQFTTRYADQDAIIRGTMFPELDLPFKDFVNTQPLPKTPLHHWMEVDFICLELKLYLNTHPNDSHAMALYNTYKENSHKAKLAVENQGDIPCPWEV